MGMRFLAEIELGNDAMQSVEALAGALRQLADKVEGGASSPIVRDINGNTVGNGWYEEVE